MPICSLCGAVLSVEDEQWLRECGVKYIRVCKKCFTEWHKLKILEGQE